MYTNLMPNFWGVAKCYDRERNQIDRCSSALALLYGCWPLLTSIQVTSLHFKCYTDLPIPSLELYICSTSGLKDFGR